MKKQGMQTAKLLGLMIRFNTNLKKIKKELSPIAYDCFREAINSDNMAYAQHVLTYPNFYTRYKSLK